MLFLLIRRYEAQTQENWVLAYGTWSSSNNWLMSSVWNMSNAYIGKTNQLEQIDIFPQLHTSTFLDDGDTIIPVDILLGEWVVSMSGNKDIGSIVQVKTVQIESEPDSSFSLYIQDIYRNTIRRVAEKYTVKRKPIIFGNAKNIKIGIENNTNLGFRINSLAYEGNVNSRSKRI